MLTVTQAAERLGVSSDTLYNWNKAGKIYIIFENSKHRFVPLEEVERIEANKIPAGMKRCKECGEVDHNSLFVRARNIHIRCLHEKDKIRFTENKDVYNSNRRDKYNRTKEQVAINDRKYRYNLTNEEYIKMLEIRNGKCAICKKVTDKLCIDHDHFTGNVRDLICSKCNIGLGQFDDSVLSLQEAIGYLNSYHSNKSYCGYFCGGC